jgi:hypothetical protein
MRNRLTAAVVLVAVCAALGACGNAEGDGLDMTTPTSVPSTSTATSSPTETATVSAEEQAVLDAYRAFYAALAQAYAHPAESQVYLAPVATGEQFEQTNSGIKANFLAGEETVGTPVLRPTVYSIADGTAIVHDCQDTTGVVRREIATDEPLVIGRNPDSVKTTLNVVDGTWKVAATEFQESAGAFC